jgi:hypothetical protein
MTLESIALLVDYSQLTMHAMDPSRASRVVPNGRDDHFFDFFDMISLALSLFNRHRPILNIASL